jgi:uncharacterized protein with HEPN domain
MNENRLEDYLEHIREAANLACSYVEGVNKDDFLADKRTQQAVTMNLIIIGEAATNLLNDHPDFVERSKNIPWKKMKGMRNQVAQGYFSINLDVVWDTVLCNKLCLN